MSHDSGETPTRTPGTRARSKYPVGSAWWRRQACSFHNHAAKKARCSTATRGHGPVKYISEHGRRHSDQGEPSSVFLRLKHGSEAAPPSSLFLRKERQPHKARVFGNT